MGDKIKQLRLSRGWSILELSKRTGVSTGMICMIENYKVNPSLKKLQAIAKTLGKDVKDLL